jgi:adenine-specific DNA-methyltransferase
MPRTRYQGSKRKLLEQLKPVFQDIRFESCLDAFGGTGSVSYLLHYMNKKVHFNDILPANAVMARALFQPCAIMLPKESLAQLFHQEPDFEYRDYIFQHFSGIYYTDQENHELDIVCQNIQRIPGEIERAEAYRCLFQACLAKRPFNLFHRANLGLRLKNTPRTFGNKTTWEKPFLTLMEAHWDELALARQALCRHHQDTTPTHLQPTTSAEATHVTCLDAFSINPSVDLVYLDPPYSKSSARQEANYFDFYHFLDGLLDYNNLPAKIHAQYQHRPFYRTGIAWHPETNVQSAFQRLFEHFVHSELVISYRSDGYPTKEILCEMLQPLYGSVKVLPIANHKYALSRYASNGVEIAIVATSPKTTRTTTDSHSISLSIL